MNKIASLLIVAAGFLTPSAALSESDILYPLVARSNLQVFAHEPFCEGRANEFEVTIDFFSSTRLSEAADFFGEANWLRNVLNQSWVTSNKCIFGSNPYELVMNLSFNGEIYGRSTYRIDGYDLVLVSQKVNSPTENSDFGLLIDRIENTPMSRDLNLIESGYDSRVAMLNEFIDNPSRTATELQLAYLSLATIHESARYFAIRGNPKVEIPNVETPSNRQYHDGDYYPYLGPLSEEALVRSSELGNGAATLELLKSLGLYGEMERVSVNAYRGNELLTPLALQLYTEHGFLFDLAKSQNAILAVKLDQELRTYGIVVSDVLEIASNAPPNEYSLERALLRGAARKIDVYDAFWAAAYPDIPDNFMASCDQDWCYSIGNIVQFRFNVSGSPKCSAVNDDITQCSFRMKLVSMISGLNDTAQGQLFGMIGANIPYLSATATFQRINGRWELSSGIQME